MEMSLSMLVDLCGQWIGVLFQVDVVIITTNDVTFYNTSFTETRIILAAEN